MRRKAFWLLIITYAGLLANKVAHGIPQTIETHYRVDEILAGGILALVHIGWLPAVIKRVVAAMPFTIWLGLFLAASHPAGSALMYFRHVFACGLVGHTIWNNAELNRWWWLQTRLFRYIAAVSYAVYVWHGILRYGWFDSDDTLIKYAKRPLLFVATFAVSHLTTFYFEMPITRWARRFPSKRNPAKAK